MIKTSLAFLAGVLLMTAVFVSTGVRFAAPMFVSGMLMVIVPMVALLSSVSRIRATARFLSAFARAWDGKGDVNQVQVVSAPRTVRDASGYVKPSTKQQRQILEDTIAEYKGDDFFETAGKVQ